MRKSKQEKKQSKKPDSAKSVSKLPSLSHKEAVVLRLLIKSRRELFGLEMVESSEGELKRGTIYVTLQRMQEKGFIESRQEERVAPEIGIPLRLYKVTGLGERVFAAYQAADSIFQMNPITAGA
jgi:DNA-binding PadR family transcriptional regulator